MSDARYLSISMGLVILGVLAGWGVCRALQIRKSRLVDLLVLQMGVLLLTPVLWLTFVSSWIVWVTMGFGLVVSPIVPLARERSIDRGWLVCAFVVAAGMALESTLFIGMKGNPRGLFVGIPF